MALYVSSVGENKNLECMLGKSVPGDLVIKLFVDNHTHADADVAGSFTEMSAQGYASKPLVTTTWGAAAQVAGVAECAYPEQTWTFDGTGGVTTIYGYYVVDAAGVLRWAEKFSSARVITNSGDLLKLTPKMTLSKV